MEQTKMQVSCMMAPKLDYTNPKEPSGTELSFYMKQFRENQAETGLSGYLKEGSATLANKLSSDQEFLHKNLPDFEFLSFYLPAPTDWNSVADSDILKEVRTVEAAGGDSSPLVSYLATDVTLQKSISDGFSHTYREDIRLRSIETALGYSNILVDFEKVIYPQSDEDSWEKLATQFAGNLVTYWKPFEGFHHTTLAQSNQKIREFLTVSYASERTEDTISLNVAHMKEESNFLLRTHNEVIDHAQGATYEELEEGVYLLRALGPVIKINLKQKQELYYYE
jgi:hypothetical protein